MTTAHDSLLPWGAESRTPGKQLLCLFSDCLSVCLPGSRDPHGAVRKAPSLPPQAHMDQGHTDAFTQGKDRPGKQVLQRGPRVRRGEGTITNRPWDPFPCPLALSVDSSHGARGLRGPAEAGPPTLCKSRAPSSPAGLSPTLCGTHYSLKRPCGGGTTSSSRSPGQTEHPWAKGEARTSSDAIHKN